MYTDFYKDQPLNTDWMPFIDHPALQDAKAELEEQIYDPSDSQIILLVGSTKAGKTFLALQTILEIEKRAAPAMQANRRLRPVAGFRVQMLTDKGFNWTNFARQHLKAMEHLKPKDSDAGDLREKVKDIHQEWTPQALFADEAHQIVRDRSEKVIRLQAEVTKSLAQDITGKLVLVGHYELAKLRKSNAQTGGRSGIIHLRRYSNSPADRDDFRSILREIDTAYADDFKIKLEEHEDTVYWGTLGLIGLLRSWLVRARSNAMRHDNRSTITESALAATAYKDDFLSSAMQEALDGEKLLAGDDAKKLAALRVEEQLWLAHSGKLGS